MSKYDIGAVEIEEEDQGFDEVKRPFAGRGVDQPRRSPIRRKHKMRAEEGIRPKAKRSHRKIQHRIKYEWEEDGPMA